MASSATPSDLRPGASRGAAAVAALARSGALAAFLARQRWFAAKHRAIGRVEMVGNSRFPPIEERPYFLSLAPYGYYWFRLQPPAPTEERYGLERDAL